MRNIILILAIIVPVLANNYDVYKIKEAKHKRIYEMKEIPTINSDVEPYLGEGLRLQGSWSPTRYFVMIQGFINGNLSIDGYVEIDFYANDPADNITLQILDINIDYDSINLFPIDDSSNLLSFVNHENDVDREFYIGTLTEPLTAGRAYRIQMDYTGSISTGLGGFYLSTYVDENGETVNLGTTQFQATDARRAFPCFDEPSYKATFEIQIAREAVLYHTLSNMPLVATYDVEDQPGWVWDVFKETPIMPSYLIAFCITDFIAVNATGDNGVITRIWGPPEYINSGQGDYSQNIAPRILDAMEDYYEFPYPISKCDHIAIPDFAAGAMENWGLVTYREPYLLWDPVHGTSREIENVAVTVSHELAHKWFGNLVTTDWWGELWLNEGFATYIAYFGVDLMDESMGMQEQFIIDEMLAVMNVDDSESSVPLKREVENLSEINGMFDWISYSKGGCIVRMITYVFGQIETRVGLVNYLNGLAYATAVEEQLFYYINEEAQNVTLDPNYNVQDIMQTWTNLPGYPIIDVTVSGDGTATITQERYIYPEDPSATMHKYWVPISYTTGDNPDFSNTVPPIWMQPSEDQITIDNFPTDTWHIFNIQYGGFLRVNYDNSNWIRISDQLFNDSDVIHLYNRIQLLDESWIYAIRNVLSYDIPMAISRYLGTEKNFAPWSIALAELDYIDAMFTKQSDYGNLQNYLNSIVPPQFDRLGFLEQPDDPHPQLLLRPLISSWACDLKYTPCLDSASVLYSQWMASPEDYNIIPPNLKDHTACAAISNGGNNEWDFAYDRYVNAQRSDDEINLLYAMGCSTDATTLEQYLDMAFDTSSELGQNLDGDYVFFGVCKNDDGGNDIAWTYLENNYQEIAAFYGGYINVQYFAQYCGEEYNTQEDLDKVQAFYDLIQPNLGPEAIMRNLITAIEDNMAWMDQNYATINTWLTDNGYGGK